MAGHDPPVLDHGHADNLPVTPSPTNKLCVHVGLAVAALVLAACGGDLAAHRVPCVDDSMCLAGEACVDGTCVAGTTTAGCDSDLDCNAEVGELCRRGACQAPPTVAPDRCLDTGECPLDQFCNTATSGCEPLLTGWCRVQSQCGAAKPVCASESPASASECVECVTLSDCGGSACLAGGVCSHEDAAAQCPPHAALVPGSTTVCQCDGGFVPDTTTGTCVAAPTTDAPATTSCVANASLVPGVDGQCRCDGGFEPNADGSACVPGGTAPPPSTSTPDPGAGGSVGGGSSDGSDSCGPNSVSLFFLCVCLPGFVVDTNGPGCTADTASSGSATCPANSSPDPSDSDFCLCDSGFVVNANADGCEEDVCATNGYYGDGFFCDDFCPFLDPDCG